MRVPDAGKLLALAVAMAVAVGGGTGAGKEEVSAPTPYLPPASVPVGGLALGPVLDLAPHPFCEAAKRDPTPSGAPVAQDEAHASMGNPDPDLHCVELTPRFEFSGASGWGEMRPAPSPFGLALTRDGVPRWMVEVRIQGLPDPSAALPGARAWVAWATGPNLVPEFRLGVVTESAPARGEVPLEQFRILVTAEVDPETPVREGAVALRGDSPSLRILPHLDPWLLGAGPESHAHPEDESRPGTRTDVPPPLAWRLPPMHPRVVMPEGMIHPFPPVSPWLPGAQMDPREVAALPEAIPTQVVELDEAGTRAAPFRLEAAPLRRTVRGREHVLLGYNGQIPGPLLRTRVGETLHLELRNALPFPTAVHWHGLRLANAFDGVPGVTQDPVPPGIGFHYEVATPDPGLFWYHPHLREDAAQGLGLYGNLQVLPAEPAPGEDGGAPEPSLHPRAFHHEVTWILDDLLLHDDGSLVPFGLEAPTHALMGRFGNVILVNGTERPVLEVEAGSVVRFLLTNAASARPFHLVVGAPDGTGEAPRMKLQGTDLSPFQREAWVEGVVLAPAERYQLSVRFDRPGRHPVENRVRGTDPFLGAIFAEVDTVAWIEVRETRAPPLGGDVPPFEVLHPNPEVERQVEALRGELRRPPDHELVLAMEVGELPFPFRPMMQMDSAYFHPVEWVDTMPEMNWPLTPAEVRWILRDGATGLENGHIDWRFNEGDLVRLRVRNEREVLHAMQHPVHIHGQRFLVLALNGVPQENLAWKDTFLLPVGWTAELLVEMSNPGDWMIHCHISEHLEAGMQTVFRVEPAEGPRWEGWRGFEPGRGGGHHPHGPQPLSAAPRTVPGGPPGSR